MARAAFQYSSNSQARWPAGWIVRLVDQDATATFPTLYSETFSTCLVTHGEGSGLGPTWTPYPLNDRPAPESALCTDSLGDRGLETAVRR